MLLRELSHSAAVAAAALAFVALVFTGPSRAETIRVVALGASNTYAQAVSASEAWPAKLESMLKAKGYDVSVSVKGVTRGDANEILSAAGSIPEGTRVVVYDTGGGNSRERGIDPAAMRPRIEQAIRARGAKPVFAAYRQVAGAEPGPGWIANDPHHHITPASHTRVAASVLPRVIAAIGKK